MHFWQRQSALLLENVTSWSWGLSRQNLWGLPWWTNDCVGISDCYSTSHWTQTWLYFSLWWVCDAESWTRKSSVDLKSREQTIIGSASYRNRYWVYRIELYRLLLYQPILRASLQVQQLLTGPVTQQIRGHSRQSSAARRGRNLIHDTGEGWRGGRRETVTWYQPPRDTKTAQYWVLATSYRWLCTPSTSRKW